MDNTQNFLKKLRGFFRQQSFPFLISLLFHTILFIIFGFLTMAPSPPVDSPHFSPKARIQFAGENQLHLQFQGKDKLESFKVLHKMVYPLPEIDYRPVLPKMDFDSHPKSEKALALIGIKMIDQRWAQTFASGRQPLYTGQERLTTSFGEYIKLLREGGLDIVFVFDATGSMAQVLRQIKNKISYLTQTIWRLVPSARIGLVAYRDVKDSYITKRLSLTYSLEKLKGFLSTIEPEGGGDLEEAVDEGLQVAINQTKWRQRAKKMLILMGDAPPHKKDIQRTYQLIEKFHRQKNGIVCCLDTSVPSNVSPENVLFKQNSPVLETYRKFALIGGGESANLIEEEKLIRQMVVLIFGTRWQEFLDEFLKSL